MQKRYNSSALAMELHLVSIKPLICGWNFFRFSKTATSAKYTYDTKNI